MGKRLDKKLKLLSKFMTSQFNKQEVKVTRSRSNQTTKFGQLVEYNIRNIFLEKSYVKLEKLVLDPFSKISKLSISLDEPSEVIYGLFIECASGRLLKYN